MICQICKKELKTALSLSIHLRTHEITAEQYYRTYVMQPNEDKCKTCGKTTAFISLTRGFRKHCNATCANLDKEVIQKIKTAKAQTATNAIEKMKQTRINNNGGTFWSSAQLQKRSITNDKRYGGTGYASDVLQEKFYKPFCIEKYGVDNPFKSHEIIKQIKETKLAKYGTTCFVNSEKTKQTNMQKYGAEHVFSSDTIKDKIQNTNNKKYGVNYPLQSEEIRNKSVNTCLQKYNSTTYIQSDEYKAKTLHIFKQQHDVNNVILSRTKNTLHCKCNICNNEFDINYQTFKSRVHSHVQECTICNPIALASVEECALVNYIKSFYSGEIRENDRTILNGKELDIYIPERKLAFEFDGLYWHNELYKDSTYHVNKTNLCEQQGIQLIHVFEDEWLHKTDIVKSRIKSLFGISAKIYARKCYIANITTQQEKDFLNANHIQGYCVSSIKYGLYYNDELVAVMTFGKSRFMRDEYELLRYASKLNTNVIGGPSKLFTHFLRNTHIEKIISYADRRWSRGNMYSKLGFTEVNAGTPSYFYVIDSLRHNRLEFQKHKLVAEGADPNKTEHEIMLDKHIYRIYDCGSKKYEYVK